MGVTKIEWADYTFNPWMGCTKISPACANCYAAVETPVRVLRGQGVELWGDRGERRRTSEANWREPLKWNKRAICMNCGFAEVIGSDDCRKCGMEFGAVNRRRPRVFCASLADVFEDHRTIMPGWRADLGRLIQNTPDLDWLLLTKRPENVMRMLPDFWINLSKPYGMPRNIWLGTTVENQEQADKRRASFEAIPAQIKFVYYEPALGPVNWDGWEFVSQIISGGESGKGARPAHPGWFHATRDWCIANRKAYFHKQHGEFSHWQDIARYDFQKLTWVEPDWFSDKMPGVWIEPDGRTAQRTNNDDAEFVYRVGKARAGRLLDGVEWNQFPEVSR
jgi:protein gp37